MTRDSDNNNIIPIEKARRALDKATAEEAVRLWRIRTIDCDAGSVIELAARLGREGYRPKETER